MEILTSNPKPQRRILVVVDSDPRTNPRVAEAVRMAGGVGVWDQVSMHVVLRGPATAPWENRPPACRRPGCLSSSSA